MFALVPNTDGKSMDTMPDCASLAFAVREKSPAWSAFSHSLLAMPS